MTKKKVAKYAGLTLALTVVCTLAFFLVLNSDVFGKFVSKEPYVVNGVKDTRVVSTEEGAIPVVDEDTTNLIVVTDEGGNQKDSTGSGKEPSCTEVPTAKGKKGTKENPFVLLEIVPDKAMQQMAYLTGNREDSGLDVMQIGIDAIKNNPGWSYADNPSFENLGIFSEFGAWFGGSQGYQYEVYKIGSDTDKEKMNLTEIGKIYSVKLTAETIAQEGYDAEQFEKDYQDYNNTDQNQKKEKYKKLAAIIKKYPKLFKTDSSGDEIRDIAKEDGQNWTIKRKAKGATHHEVIFTDENVDINQYNFSAGNIVKNNPDVFAVDSDGNAISQSAREDTDNWSGEHTGTKHYDYTVQVKETEAIKQEYEEYESGAKKATDLIQAHPDLFKKDKDGKSIEESRLQADGWEIKKKENVEFATVAETGYLHYMGEGKGNYKLEERHVSSINAYAAVIIGTEANKGDFEYSPEAPEGLKEGSSQDLWKLTTDPTLYWSMATLRENYWHKNVVTLDYATMYTFSYNKTVSSFSFEYDGGDKTLTYTFNYYGLKTNNVLKRSLFSFTSEQQCKDFEFRVICMTPAELNKMAREDAAKNTKEKNVTNDTLDMIERADMFYIATYAGNTDNLSQVYKLYNTYIKDSNEAKHEFNKDDLKSFYENDLEWDLCMKILKRASTKKTLPVVFTQNVGQMIEDSVGRGTGNSDTNLYLTAADPNLSVKGSLNNLSKLYLILIQLDVLARKVDGDCSNRTFAEDIMPNIKTIPLSEETLKGADPDTATTTGYYEREKNELLAKSGPIFGDQTEEKDRRCYYLWSKWTFYPSDLGGNKDDVFAISEYVKYGFLATFFNTNAQAFRDGDMAAHQSGSDGTDDRNVTIVSAGSNSDVNHSTLIGNTENAYVVNNVLEAAYQIMNRQPETVTPLTVRVEKQKKMYEKLSDELVLVDYRAAGKYKSDKQLFLKVTVGNPNNESGIINAIHLVNEDGKTPTHSGYSELVPRLSLDASSALKKEKIYDSKGKYGVLGYEVKDELTFYVPYQLSDWQKGYNTLQFTLQGRIYSAKLKTSVLGAMMDDNEVLVSERTLFKLN